MIVYSITTILTMFLVYQAYRARNAKLKTRRFWRVLSAIPLIIISGIRYGVGQDYFYTYVPYFQAASAGYFKEGIEYGFEFLTRFVLMFSDDYVWLFLLCSVFFFYIVFNCIYEYSPDPVMSVFLLVGTGYLFVFYNGMRQMMAVSLILFSLRYIKNGNVAKYVFVVLIASLFHISALLCIPAYFVRNIKIDFKKFVALILLLTLFSTQIVSFLLNIISYTKYFNYIGSVYDTGKVGYVTIFIQLAELVFAYLFISKSNKGNSFINTLLVFKMISVFISIFDGVLPLMVRIRWYFDLSTIVLIPVALTKIKEYKSKQIIRIMVYLVFIMYFIYTIGVLNHNNVLPYRTIFSR